MTDWLDDAYREAERDQVYGVEKFKALLREKHEESCPHKAEVERLKDLLAEARKLAGEAIPFIMTGDVCDAAHPVDLLRAAAGKESNA